MMRIANGAEPRWQRGRMQNPCLPTTRASAGHCWRTLTLGGWDEPPRDMVQSGGEWVGRSSRGWWRPAHRGGWERRSVAMPGEAQLHWEDQGNGDEGTFRGGEDQRRICRAFPSPTCHLGICWDPGPGHPSSRATFAHMGLGGVRGSGEEEVLSLMGRGPWGLENQGNIPPSLSLGSQLSAQAWSSALGGWRHSGALSIFIKPRPCQHPKPWAITSCMHPVYRPSSHLSPTPD